MRNRWERDTRYYEAEACTDLFGTPCVRLTFGRIAGRQGRQLTRPCSSWSDVNTLLLQIERRRLRRGYVLRTP